MGIRRASSMSFQNNLCDLRVLGGEYVTSIPEY